MGKSLAGMRDHLHALFPRRIGGRIVVAFTVIGGVSGIYYLISETEAKVSTVIVAALALVLLMSIGFHGRQFVLWRRERERAGRAEAMYDMAKTMERASRRMYESTEQRQWTFQGVHWTSRLLPAHKAGDASSVMVDVTVEKPMHPVQLRFWFSSEVSSNPLPLVQIERPGEPEPDEKWSPGEPVNLNPVRVSGDGRVDVFIMRKTLQADSSLRLIATAVKGGSFELLRVERSIL